MLKIEIFSNIKARESGKCRRLEGMQLIILNYSGPSLKLYLPSANATVIAVVFFSCYHYLRVSLIHVSNHFCFKQADSSLSQYLSPVIKKKIRAQENPKEKKKKMSSPSKRREMDLMKLLVIIYQSFSIIFIFLGWKLLLIFLLAFFFSLVGFVWIGWWAITKWRWSMMAFRSSMYIFRDLMKVNSLIPAYLSLFCNFFTFLVVFCIFLS